MGSQTAVLCRLPEQSERGPRGLLLRLRLHDGGGLLLFLIDLHKRSARRRHKGGSQGYEEGGGRAHPERRATLQAGARLLAAKQHRVSNELLHRQELTCISEEAAAFDDFCITSCNKEEKYLMLSEFENNLLNTHESSSVSQEVRRLARERRVSGSSPPLLEHCPNCLRVVAVEGDTGPVGDREDFPRHTCRDPPPRN
ncbi:monocarboxylate transporter 12 [Caerostris extrusa]|uniref:Monocarboxylate transporter 12 n=1 Tax=Caerostris extrusa TaxID=172846 RepID=A0AAV4SVA8_CAEEX|nr:monocarboxylate transporter 12 [Caerostris extrusa]